MGQTIINADDTTITPGFLTKWDQNGDHYSNTYKPQKGIEALGHTHLGTSAQSATITVNETTGATTSNNATIYPIDTTSGDITVNLPTVATSSTTARSKRVTITKTSSDANRVLIDGASSELVGGAQVLVLYRQGDSVTPYAENVSGAWHLEGPRPTTIYAAVAASSALTASSVETTFDTGSFSIPANSLRAGEVIEIEGQGIATAHNASDTLTVKLYIGSTQILTTGAVNYTANDIFTFRARIVVRDIGATGHIVATGVQILGNEGTAEKNFKLASTAIDTTAAQTIACKGTLSSNSGSNSCRLDVFNAKRAA